MSSKERKSRLTDKQQAILDIVITAIEALVVVVCIVVSVLVWVGASDPADRTINWFAVQTDSMMGDGADNFNPGDLVFTKKPSSPSDIQKGVIIAYKAQVRGSDGEYSEQILIHRVNKVLNEMAYDTKGDNTNGTDEHGPSYNDIIGVYTGKVKGLGKVVLWLGGYKKVTTQSGKTIDPNLLGGYGYEKTGSSTTFLVIIIPLALLFLYNGYVVVKWTMDEKAKKIRAAALAEVQQAEQDQEALKRQALTEYMRANGMSDEQIAQYFAELDARAVETADEQPADAESVAEADAEEAKPTDGTEV